MFWDLNSAQGENSGTHVTVLFSLIFAATMKICFRSGNIISCSKYNYIILSSDVKE